MLRCAESTLTSGDLETARDLARRNIDAFLAESPSTPSIVASAGCGVRMKEYDHLLEEDDPDYGEKAASLV